MRLSLFLIALILIFSGCDNIQKENISFQDESFKSIFIEHTPEQSGLVFDNQLDEKNLKNPFVYVNAYNGGGVAIGDINNDGLQDVYLTGNMVPSRLFLNKGDFTFEDISDKAGVKADGWCTGPSMVDVNQDGWLDIYVCRSYHNNDDQRKNLLYINNQDGTFSEKAAEFGIDDPNYSVTASFFDYDLDGDLDLAVGNHPRNRLLPFQQLLQYWKNPVPKYSNKLYRNDDGKYTDVTEKAGLLTYSFTLGLITSDLNYDGYPEIYFAVDHDEPDILLLNNKDGTFSNITKTAVKQISRSSMGIDAGDVNHDLYPDIIVAEMLSEDHYREKISMSMQSVDRFRYLIDNLNLKYYQMRNFLHLNNGNNTFSDIAQLANVHKTDWSWSPLFIDADNDGWQDLFVSNGYYRDIYNQDMFKAFDSTMLTLGNDNVAKNKLAGTYARNCPQPKVHNYLFKNNGNLRYDNVSELAGFTKETISTGAAFGDLDNDGDIDLVINNLGELSMVYENKTSNENGFLRIGFKHNPGVINLGAKVIIEDGTTTQSRELLTTRGFQASCEPFVHFGVGSSERIEKVKVIWPDNKMEVFENVKPNQLLEADYRKADDIYIHEKHEPIFAKIPADSTGIGFTHTENYYDDFDDQVLLPHKMSEQGPFITVADVNKDGEDDFFVGGAAGQAGKLFIQINGKFHTISDQVFEKDRAYEDAHSSFFDVENDGDLDLLVSSGGYELPHKDPLYQPRLYINDKGEFKRSMVNLPDLRYSSSVVSPVDFDSDGDMDVFIGGRLSPKRYPETGRSSLLINDGKGNFEDKTVEIYSSLDSIGMVTDAIWTDLNFDEKPDLILVGEWMPITFLVQEDGKLKDRTDSYFTLPQTGWWNTIESADLDENGLQDFIVGNLGYNYKYKASKDKPFQVFADDIDNNGSFDIVLGAYYGDVVYPVRGRSCSSEQIPEIKKKFPTYHEYAKADIEKVYGESLKKALHYDVIQFASVILFQTEKGRFEIQELPIECQKSPVNGIVVFDVNKDGNKDIIIAGNHYQAEIETGRADAGTGTVIINEENSNWNPLKVYESGLYLDKDLKSMEYINYNGKPAILAGNNNDEIQLIRILQSKKTEKIALH